MTVSERIPAPEVADAWIRACLGAGSGRAEVTVSGTCMEPAVQAGSRILLRPPRGLVRVGDVVLVRTPNGLRLHRVLASFRGVIRTKGDRGAYLDPAGTVADIIAVSDANESRSARTLRVCFSLARLLARPWSAEVPGSGDGDGGHARVLL